MRRHVPRWLVVVMAVSGVLGLVIMGGTWWAMGTAPGARWTVERLGAFMPGKLTVDTLSGPVRGPLLAHGVTYETDHFKLTAARVWVDWRLRYLIEKRLDIRALEADSVRLVMYPGPEKAQLDTLNELADVDLPLDVLIGRARFRDFHFTRAGRREAGTAGITGPGTSDATGADSAMVLDEIALERVALRDTLSIGGARVRSASFDADMKGGATLKGRHPVQLDVTWTWRGGGRPLSGRGPIVGDLDRLHVVQTVRGPLAADADVIVLDGLRNPQLSGVLAVQEFRPRDMNPAWPEGRANGRITLAGRLNDLHSAGTVRATLPQLPGVVLTYRAERAGDRLIVHDAQLDVPGAGNQITFNGTIVTSPQPDLHLAGRWTAVTWPPGDSAIVSPSGTFQIDGPPTAYRLHAGGRVGTGSIPPMPLEVRGTGGRNGIAFSSVRSQALGGAIAGSGAIDWAGGVDWRVALRASGLDPATAWPQYPGRIGFALRASGASAAAGMRGDFALEGLTGTVRDYPVRGQAAAAFAPGRLAIRSLDLGWGPDSVIASGAVGGPWTLTASVNAPDLSVPIAGGTGSLHAQVKTSGGGPKPRTAVTLQADTVRWGSGSIHHVAGSADLDLSGAGASRLDVQADGLRSGTRRLVRLGVTGNGTLRAHTLEARAAGQQDSLRVALRGGWLRGAWQGLLEAVDLATQHAGTWALEHPSRATLAPARVQVADVAWRSGNATVAGNVDWRREGAWSSRLDLQSVPLAVAEPWFTPGVGLEGTMSGTAAVGRTPGGRMSADADLAVGPGALTWPAESGRGRIRLDRGTVSAHGDGGAIAARMAITSPDAGSVDGDVRLGMSAAARPTLTTMTGSARARLDSLEFLQAFVPGLRRTAGRLTADLRVTGTIAHPVWSGNAQLAGGAADVQRLGIRLQDVTLTARGEDSRHLALNLHAMSEGGTLTFTGDARVEPDGSLRATGTVRGDRFELMDNPDGRIVVTPNVELASVGDSLRVRGTVLVPTGFIHAGTTGDQVVKSSRDVVLVTPAGEVDRRDPNLIAEVRVTLGNDVHLDTYGLKGRVEGGLLVMDHPGWPSSGTGELRIMDGTYRAYGQNLKIERGRILFGGGPLKNPGLDVRATRTAGDGTVAGFEVRGSLEAPRLTVVSDPPMSQQDALGYVLFGRPMHNTSTNEQAMVRDAGDALGVAGGSFLAGKVAQPLGLDEASVQSSGGLNQASLMLGRYLSPRLYLNYGIGILDQVSTVRLRYTLSRMWTIQAESGNETRGQVQYTVER